MESFVQLGRIGSKDLLRVLGRVQFADAQVMGRAGKLALAEVRRWSVEHLKEVTIAPQIRDAFEILLLRLTSGAPRTVPCRELGQPVLVFTDGASEGELHTIGGILVRPIGSRPRFFACRVPARLVGLWSTELKHLIGPVECYAALVARAVWHQHVAQKPCIHFIDNVATL